MKRIFNAAIIILAMLVTLGAAPARPDGAEKFDTHLRGTQEVPPRETKAKGVAKFKLSKDGTALDYKLTVSNIENVAAAHIHCAAVGVNGPVGVTLFLGAAASGPVSGVLARGTIIAPDSPNGCGWSTLADVVAAMRTGNTYVNVHTNDGVEPINTGPGDFPGGEIRGQIE